MLSRSACSGVGVLLSAATLLGVDASAAASTNASTTPSIVTRHDRDDARYRALGVGYPEVVSLNGGEGTLIAPRWILTAAHVAQHVEVGVEVEVAGVLHRVTRVVMHPEISRRPFRNDIALVELDASVVAVEPAALYRGRDEVGRIVTFVGRGWTGNGRDGLIRRSGGVMRGATNRVEEADEFWVTFRFDSPETATELEGISGPGDSGGPAFIELAGRRHIVGVSSWQNNREQNDVEGVYGVIEHYARVSAYVGWMDSTIGDR